MKTPRLMGKALIFALLAALLAAWVPAPPAARAETVRATIPVSAAGADCTARLRDGAGGVLQTLPLRAGAAGAFDVALDRLGQYDYTVDLADADTDDVVYDHTVYNVRVHARYEGDDVMAAVVIEPEGASGDDGKVDEAAFVNTPLPAVTPAVFRPAVRKRVIGSPETPALFTFAMSAVSNTAGVSLADMPMPGGIAARQAAVKVTGDGEADFGDITFTAPGDYVYRVTEVNGGVEGYQYDSGSYTLTVRVTRQDRALSAAAALTRDDQAADAAVFINTYGTPEPGLSIEKTVANTSLGGTAYTLGEAIEYRLTVTNTGNVHLTHVAVEDPLTGLSEVIPELRAGDNAVLTTRHTVTAADIAAGRVHNTATVEAPDPTGDNKPPLTGEDTVSSLTRLLTPGLEITKVTDSAPADGAAYVPGETILYTLTVTNTGNVALTDLTVTDSLLPGRTWTIPSLAAGASHAIEDVPYTATLADARAGQVVNAAHVRADNPLKPGESLTDDDSVTDPAHVPESGVTIAKEITGAPANGRAAYAAGEVIRYRLTVTNTGATALTGVAVDDEKTGFHQTLETLASGESRTLTTEYTVTAADVAAGSVINVATVAADDPVDPDAPPLTDDDDAEAPTGELTPALRLTKAVVSAPANGTAYVLGEAVEYRITVTNTGNVDLVDVDVEDPLTGLSVTVPELKVGASAEHTTRYTVQAADVLAGHVLNTATAEAPDPTDGTKPPLTDSDEATVPVEAPRPGLSIEKTVAGAPPAGTAYAPGETIEYRLTVTNTGNVDLTAVRVTDPLTDFSEVIARLNAGASVQRSTRYVVQASDRTAGTVHNTARAEAADPTNPDRTLSDEDGVTSPVLKTCAIDPPVKKVVKGNPSGKANFTFTLTAVSNTAGYAVAAMPMPEGASNGAKSVTIRGAGQKEFGAITYERAGTYVYSVTEKNTGAAHYTYDSTAYTLTVEVTREGDSLKAKQTVKVNGTTAAGMTFTNTYTAPSGGGTSTDTDPEPDPEPESTITLGGYKIWVDDGNAHGTRPESITLRLYADGAPVSATPAWSSTTGDHWAYTFSDLREFNADGSAIQYTVDEEPVENYQTSVIGTTVTNTLIEREPQRRVTISGLKRWKDSDEARRADAVTVRLRRDGVEVDSRRITAGDGWRYAFENLPADDGYGNAYAYTVHEDPVPGYFPRVDGYDIVNTRLPAGAPAPDNPLIYTAPPVHFEVYTEEELEKLLELFDYKTPLWGSLLKTGDETPLYPFVFGGIGLMAVLALLVLGRKRQKR